MTGREIVVTGAQGALGVAVVERLIEEGARPVLPVRSEGASAAAREALGDRGTVLTGIDATDSVAVEGLFEMFGPDRPLWASVHLVGGFLWAGIEDAPASAFDAMFSMNAKSCYLACREAAAAMRRSGGGGRIVNVTARPGLVPSAGASMVAYTGAKAAVAAMTVALSEELAPDGIWVNAVAPSIIDTPRNRRDMPDADHQAWPKPAELAETIAFLVSPSNASTRGGLIPVYGKV